MKIRKKKQFIMRVFLILTGIAINCFGNFIVTEFSLPLYLDSIGTILVAALAGIVPGIVTGYFTNLLSSITNMNSMYFGLISILIAIVAGNASAKGCFQKWRRMPLVLPFLALIGGVLGTILSCFINGFVFSDIVINDLARWFYKEAGFSFMVSEFCAGILTEIVDKGFSLVVVYIILHTMSDAIKSQFDNGELYLQNAKPVPLLGKRKKKYHHSLQKEVVALISIASISVGLIAGIICFMLYQDSVYDTYLDSAKSVAELVTRQVPVDKIDTYVATAQKDDEYKNAQDNIEKVVNAFPEVKYLHIYQVQKNGGYVVFDVDVEGVQADQLGQGVSLERPHEKDMLDLLQNKQKDYVVSHSKFGWLFTIYEPIMDSDGNRVAYICVDMDMQKLVDQRVSYVTKMASVLFSTLIVICVFAIWYAQTRIVRPINAMTEMAAEYAYKPEEQKKNFVAEGYQLDIHTGNEIEGLYYALNKTMRDVTQYINDIQEQAEVIAKMQYNIISVFADMVENRDENTGEHIHRTAAFVGIIARELKREGQYTDILTEQYIEDLEISAPLHDIGKIKISDSILNKPGRLTDEEFEKMKTHAGEGRKILQKATDNLGAFSYLMISMDMSGYHHERWDGTGYPERLKGDSIPLCARIMAVADVFDALISKRSYKDAFSFEKAVSIIEEERGTHFDPVIVDAFLNALDEIQKVVCEENNAG